MFVVDSFDRERLGEAKTELWQILKDQRLRKEAVLIVFANKQDLSNSLTPDEVQKQLELTSVTDRPWCECSECKHTRTHTCRRTPAVYSRFGGSVGLFGTTCSHCSSLVVTVAVARALLVCFVEASLWGVMVVAFGGGKLLLVDVHMHRHLDQQQ